ncbi:MAG TPA: cytochrome c biogenesis protein CcdA [Candidatus Limnocylindrales bacterium]|nr:cytochrome c biogenesis protein CcdA [Candidatus Limnocylindrales bacterium]
MSGSDLTILVAIAAGLLSFLSPCVLPLVPAYVGQLTRVAVRSAAEQGDGTAGPSRWVALRHAIAYVAGFGLVFTLLGVTATFAGGALGAYLPALREAGGLILIVLGLNLAGILTVARFQRSWQPLLAGGASSLATSGGGSLIGARTPSSWGDRLGARLTGSSNAWLASFGLGVIFAVGWTPCIGTILGGILTLAATSDGVLRGGILLVAYTLGLGIPFLVLGLLYDRAPRLLRPLLRHGRAVSLVGGLLVVAIGVAMLFDLLIIVPRYLTFLTAI